MELDEINQVKLYLLEMGKFPLACDPNCCLHLPSFSIKDILRVETGESGLQQNITFRNWLRILHGHRDAQNRSDGDPSHPPG